MNQKRVSKEDILRSIIESGRSAGTYGNLGQGVGASGGHAAPRPTLGDSFIEAMHRDLDHQILMGTEASTHFTSDPNLDPSTKGLQDGIPRGVLAAVKIRGNGQIMLAHEGRMLRITFAQDRNDMSVLGELYVEDLGPLTEEQKVMMSSKSAQRRSVKIPPPKKEPVRKKKPQSKKREV